MKPITLKGHLGSDREYRETRERTKTVTRWNEVAEMHEEYDVTIPSRTYARLSLATQARVDGRWETVWHQLVVWDVDRMDYIGVRIGRKGDRVEVTGYEETWRFKGDDGEEREIRRIVVTSYRCIRPRRAPEHP